MSSNGTTNTTNNLLDSKPKDEEVKPRKVGTRFTNNEHFSTDIIQRSGQTFENLHDMKRGPKQVSNRQSVRETLSRMLLRP